MITTKFISTIFALMCVSVTVQAAAVSPQDCGEMYQSQLKEFLASTCDSAAFHDCCQVYIQLSLILTS